MRISKVRKYLEQEIKLIFPKMTPWKDAFDEDNIPSTKLENTYFISYSVPSGVNGQGIVTKTVDAKAVFYFKGKTKAVDKFDEGMDGVNQVSIQCQSLESMFAFRATDDFPIQSVDFVSQVPEQLANDDNTIKITLELSLEIIQTIC